MFGELCLLLQIKAENMELVNLQDVVNCIIYFKLELKFPLDYILSRIKELENSKQMKKRSASSLASPPISKRQENFHQLGSPDMAFRRQPMPHQFGHTTPVTPNVQSTWQQAGDNACI